MRDQLLRAKLTENDECQLRGVRRLEQLFAECNAHLHTYIYFIIYPRNLQRSCSI